MGELGQRRLQGAIALAGFAGALLPRTFVVAWGHAGPCRQTGRGLKPCHINANLRHDDFCPTLVHPGNGVQEFDGVGKAPQGVTPSSCKTPRAGGSLVWQRVACHKRDRSPNTVALCSIEVSTPPSSNILFVTYAMMESRMSTKGQHVAGRDGVDFVAVVDQAIALLRQRGRLTYRTLQRQCTVDRLPR